MNITLENHPKQQQKRVNSIKYISPRTQEQTVCFLAFILIHLF